MEDVYTLSHSLESSLIVDNLLINCIPLALHVWMKSGDWLQVIYWEPRTSTTSFARFDEITTSLFLSSTPRGKRIPRLIMPLPTAPPAAAAGAEQSAVNVCISTS